MSKTIVVSPPALSASKSRKEALGVIGAIVAGAIVLLLPTPEGLSPAGHRLAAIFVGALVLWSTEALPMAVTALLVIVLQPILGINAIGPAIATSISPIFFFVLVMFIIAYAWVKTGLARRFAIWMISKAGTDTRRVVYVFMGGTAVISTVVSDVPTAAIFMAIALSIFEKLQLAPGTSQFGRVVMLGIPIASLIGGIATPAGSSINLLGLDMIEQNGGQRIPFLHWMAIGVPMAIILLPIAAWVLLKFYPPEIESIGSLDEIHRERKEMGAITGNEWKVIVIMGTMITLWILSTWYPQFNVYTVALAGAIVMFLPGIGLFTWREIQGVTGWDTLLLIAGITSIGAASSSTGLAAYLARTLLGGLQDWSTVLVIAVISAFTVVIHLVLPIAPVINAVMIPPIMAVAAATGQNGALYALPVIFTASCAFLLPLDAVPLVTYAKGYYKFFDMFLPGLIISIAWVIVMTAVMLVIAPMLGLV
jgi:sodium-dependent dicarboxylate transporter 2/3/5